MNQMMSKRSKQSLRKSSKASTDEGNNLLPNDTENSLQNSELMPKAQRNAQHTNQVALDSSADEIYYSEEGLYGSVTYGSIHLGGGKSKPHAYWDCQYPDVVKESASKSQITHVEKDEPLLIAKNIHPYVVEKVFEWLQITDTSTKSFRLNEVLISKQKLQHDDPKHLFFYVINNRFEQLKLELEKDDATQRDIALRDASLLPPNKHESFAMEQSSEKPLVECTDAVGANIIHIAYLFERYAIGRYLVRHYPELALQGYSDKSTYKDVNPEEMPYTGENILHMTIVKKNHAEVRWLLDFYRDRKFAIPCGSCAPQISTATQRNGDSHPKPQVPGLQMLLQAQVKGSFFTTISSKHYFGGI